MKVMPLGVTLTGVNVILPNALHLRCYVFYALFCMLILQPLNTIKVDANE